MKTAVHIGANVSAEAITASRDALKMVLFSAAGDKVKVAAIEALSKTWNVSNVTLNDMDIDARETHHHYPSEDAPEVDADGIGTT